MIKTMYAEALSQLAVPKLKLFNEKTDIEGFAGMKAGEKRLAMLEALGGSEALRGEFVEFYGQQTGTDAKFAEWEAADAPGTPTEEPAPAPVPAVAPEATAPGHFVDGALEQMFADVAGMDAESSDANLKEIEEKLEFEHVRMGVLLSHIQQSQHYATLGYANMKEYLEAQTIGFRGLHYRKAMFLIANANKIKELGIPFEDLKGVSWSALRHITPVLTKKNYGKWLEAARTLTHVALQENVQAEKDKQDGKKAVAKDGDTPTEVMAPKAFNLFPDQKKTVEDAVEKAKAEGGVESAGAALDLIASAFLGAPASDTTVKTAAPDTSDAGLANYVGAVQALEGWDGALRVLNAVADAWPLANITVGLEDEGKAAYLNMEAAE